MWVARKIKFTYKISKAQGGRACIRAEELIK